MWTDCKLAAGRQIWAELDQPRWFGMFKLASHIAFDSSWTVERKRDWAGNEVADLAAKRALEAWRKDAENADECCGWANFAHAVTTNVAESQSFCLQNLPFAANDVLVRRAVGVPFRAMLLSSHIWSSTRLMIRTPCGSKMIL